MLGIVLAGLLSTMLTYVSFAAEVTLDVGNAGALPQLSKNPPSVLAIPSTVTGVPADLSGTM
jgi:hypothetical protein